MTANNAIIKHIKSKEADMFALLEKMVLIQSGSYNKNGVDRVARLVESTFESNRVSCQRIEQKDYGNHLVVRSLARRSCAVENRSCTMTRYCRLARRRAFRVACHQARS